MIKEPLSYHPSPIMCFQELNYTHFGIKNVGLGKFVIQNLDHLDIKSNLAHPIGGLNCEVPLYKKQLCVLSLSNCKHSSCMVGAFSKQLKGGGI